MPSGLPSANARVNASTKHQKQEQEVLDAITWPPQLHGTVTAAKLFPDRRCPTSMKSWPLTNGASPIGADLVQRIHALDHELGLCAIQALLAMLVTQDLSGRHLQCS